MTPERPTPMQIGSDVKRTNVLTEVEQKWVARAREVDAQIPPGEGNMVQRDRRKLLAIIDRLTRTDSQP